MDVNGGVETEFEKNGVDVGAVHVGEEGEGQGGSVDCQVADNGETEEH